jgi:putative oxidoreductase
MDERGESTATSIGLLVLRVGIGAYVASHGIGKLHLVLEGKFDQFADPIGIGTGASLVLVMLAEFFGALAVIVGLATRFSAAAIAFSMLVAAFLVHGSDPWTMEEAAKRMMAGEAKSLASKEPALLYAIANLALVLTGAGRISLDAALCRWRRARRSRA